MLCWDAGGQQRDEPVARSLQLHESAALNCFSTKIEASGCFFSLFLLHCCPGEV